MTDTVVHPGIVLIVGALLLPWLPGALRRAAALALPLAALWLVGQLEPGTVWRTAYLDQTLTLVRTDRLSLLFAAAFAFMAAAGALYAWTQNARVEMPAALAYAGAAIGVALAGDWLTLFVFWEVMAVASTLVIWCGGTSRSYRASLRYLMIHLLGGVLLFAGIAGHVAGGGSPAVGALALDSPAHWLMLAGVVINAGAPPLAAWIPDAYPEASWSGSVFLSSFTTKAAVLVLMRAFAGHEVLVWTGLFMALHGVVMALLASDLRRILAYSIINQVGLMVVGIGIGTELALNGAAAHALASLLYTALLFMSAGALLRATDRRDLFALGGMVRRMPLASAAAAVGALSLSALPLTAGFVTKSMTMQAAADAHLLPVWLLMVAASAGAFVYMGLRALWLGWLKPVPDAPPVAPTPRSMQLAMVLLALLCVALGAWPQALYAWLPFPVDYRPYTGAHLVAQAQLMLFAALAFAWLRPGLAPSVHDVPDFDWLWRVPLPRAVRALARVIDALLSRLRRANRRAGRRTLAAVLRHHGPQGSIARTWPTGSMAMWVLVLLLGYLLLYYI